MIIDARDNKILITKTNSNLKPRHVSQLNDWGIIKDNEESFCLKGEIELILPKLLRYFDKSNLEYSLTDSCRQLIKKIDKELNRYIELKELCKNYKNGIFDIKSFKEHLIFLQTKIKRKLKEHQVKASYHLSILGNAANFSVPGSGKTTVVLSVYEKLRLVGEVNILFVIGPPSCFGPWRAEFFEVFQRRPKCCVLAGESKPQRIYEYFKAEDLSDLYLITFQTLQNDQDEVRTFLKNKNVKAFLVIDEAHYIKQVGGNWANAVLRLSNLSKYKCVLTGTPIPRSYTDLFNQFDFLWPNINPISSSDKIKIRLLEDKKDYESAGQIIRESIGPLFYRVRKSELGLKPQVFYDPDIIQMNYYEKKVYDAIVKKIKNYSKEDYLKNIDFVIKLQKGRMIRLRQCISYTKLLNTSLEDYEEDLLHDEDDLRYIIQNYDKLEIPAKLIKLIEFVKRLNSEQKKVVIWSNFINSIKHIEKKIKESGFNCKKIIGETPVERISIRDEETREKIISEFIERHSGLDILIANPAACAESISLHKTCFNAIYYDLSYNCAQYLQSLDRIHRVGGSEKNEAFYNFLQYDKTIDNDILTNLRNKAKRMYNVIENDYNIYSLDMFEDSDEIEAYNRIFKS